MEMSVQPQDTAAVPLGKTVPRFHQKDGCVSPTASLRHLDEDKNISIPQQSAATPTILSWLPCMQIQTLFTCLHLLRCGRYSFNHYF